MTRQHFALSCIGSFAIAICASCSGSPPSASQDTDIINTLKAAGAEVEVGILYKGVDGLCTRIKIDARSFDCALLRHVKQIGAPVVLWITAAKDSDIANVSGAANVQEILIYQSECSFRSISRIAEIPNLKHLDNSGFPVGDEGVQEIVKLHGLESIRFDASTVTNHGLSMIGRLTNLRLLSLGSSKITPGGLQALSECKLIGQLNVRGARIADDDLDVLVNMENLQFLGLAETPITDACVPKIAKLGLLLYVDLQGTQISEEGVAHLRTLRPGLTYGGP